MKKKWIVLFIFVLLISGCSFSSKEQVNLSFEDSQNIFAQNMANFYENINYFIQNKGYKYKNFCSFDGGNASFKFYSSLDLSGATENIKNLSGKNNNEQNFNKDIIFDIYYKDSDKLHGNNLQGNLFLKKVQDLYFAKISQGVADLGTGNYEGEFLGLLLKNLEDKWIQYDPAILKQIEEINKKISFIFYNLKDDSLFKNIEKVTYEGDIAYKVTVSDDLKQKTNFQGTLIVRNEDVVELKFDDFQTEINGKEYYMRGKISDKYGIISIKDSLQSTKSIDINYFTKNKSLNLVISGVENFNTLRGINLTISDFWTQKSPKKSNINGNLILNPILIYGSDLENEIKINIYCSYEKNILSGNFLIQEPDSYILLDQILGDSFSLKSILSS